VQQGRTVCQNLSKFERLEITRGCLPWIIREEHLVEAATLAQAKASLLASSGDARKVRLFRGWWALTNALQQFYASDRIHGFVRALEALVYPEVGKTEKQFVHRCSLFAASRAAKNKARAVEKMWETIAGGVFYFWCALYAAAKSTSEGGWMSYQLCR